MVRRAKDSKPRSVALSCFNLKTIEDGAVVVVIGKRRSGKTVLMKDILYTKRRAPAAMIISPTEKQQGAFRGKIPPWAVHPEPDEATLGKLMARQQWLFDNMPPHLHDKATIVTVLDDCGSFKKHLRGEKLKQLFMNGRHMRVFLMISLQYVTDLTPDLRSQADYVFSFKDARIPMMKRLYEEFFSMTDFKTFVSMYRRVTMNYGCIVYRAAGNDLSDTTYWYRAKVHDKKPWRVGCAAFWNPPGQAPKASSAAPRALSAPDSASPASKAPAIKPEDNDSDPESDAESVQDDEDDEDDEDQPAPRNCHELSLRSKARRREKGAETNNQMQRMGGVTNTIATILPYLAAPTE